tara:strand:+ start:1671 stop:2300 length:630 start_codon:yes stop_codon:yes gene_type:complete
MNLAYKLIHAFAVPLIRNCYNIHIKNSENLVKGPAIIAANQPSHLDGFVLISGIQNKVKKHIHFMTKQPSRYNLFLGKYLAEPFLNSGDHIILQNNHLASEQLRKITSLLNQGDYLGIFPEGVTNNTGKLRRFKNGAATISRLTQTPIIPTYIKWGASETNPKCPFWENVYINFGKAISLLKKTSRNGEDSKLTQILKESIEAMQLESE